MDSRTSVHVIKTACHVVVAVFVRPAALFGSVLSLSNPAKVCQTSKPREQGRVRVLCGNVINVDSDNSGDRNSSSSSLLMNLLSSCHAWLKSQGYKAIATALKTSINTCASHWPKKTFQANIAKEVMVSECLYHLWDALSTEVKTELDQEVDVLWWPHMGGTVDVTGKGYRGGVAPRKYRNTAPQGESSIGIGCPSTEPNGGGGGGGVGSDSYGSTGGGGGCYGTRGRDSPPNTYRKTGPHPGGKGGNVVPPSIINNTLPILGSGGGAGDPYGYTAGSGGAVVIEASEIDIQGTIQANGNPGGSGKSYGSGGGGGSGGLIALRPSWRVALGATGTLTASGGEGGSCEAAPLGHQGICSRGGGGGDGWICLSNRTARSLLGKIVPTMSSSNI
ncbi:hypothetical protein Pelo_18516 [Pelomyxa schiedti]|nr:hypothetical protein Pelo_18516 [Pelomyxa schiedti]